MSTLTYVNSRNRLSRPRAQDIRFCARAPLILVNGLAEQPETWYRNAPRWRRHFDVYQPNLAAYIGAALHRRIEERLPIDVPYLVERLQQYLENFVATPPYRFVANSMGGKIMVDFALSFPDQVERLALICPSGLSSEEHLPIVEGVRARKMDQVIESVFHNPKRVDRAIIAHYQNNMRNKRWRVGALRTIRGTMGHQVGDRIAELNCPTLMIVGGQDRIVDPQDAILAARRIPNGKLVVVPNCGHAPQIEQADYVNRLVIEFMRPEANGQSRSPKLP